MHIPRMTPSSSKYRPFRPLRSWTARPDLPQASEVPWVETTGPPVLRTTANSTLIRLPRLSFLILLAPATTLDRLLPIWSMLCCPACSMDRRPRAITTARPRLHPLRLIKCINNLKVTMARHPYLTPLLARRVVLVPALATTLWVLTMAWGRLWST